MSGFCNFPCSIHGELGNNFDHLCCRYSAFTQAPMANIRGVDGRGQPSNLPTISPSPNDTPGVRTHDIGSDTTCRTLCHKIELNFSTWSSHNLLFASLSHQISFNKGAILRSRSYINYKARLIYIDVSFNL